ncbi:23S rRNA (adenine(2503)-C(2))-methyltransferase RlmN [Parvicella tangerina]|uniref:Probable dual-specificity RNA methyltransferase RlmN n=1 Tax=Parvicella tangerina TaxID=2829795 RepID=A0A916JPQ5_9FLAO|nr:23S rRNA (adenine(2503)-C(2))-methyltransferase RlmN [Parvicella tangerina]CAG5085813.1 Dual-specificity RNA methyltransferase RlmN [Parvicella tangerina]
MATTTSNKTDIRQLDLQELKDYFVEIGEKPFRAKQVYEWLWKKGATSFEGMTNLSLDLREKLNETFEIRFLTVAEAQKSNDRTIKDAFKLADGAVVEGVLIPTSKRMTACVSTQVGCSLNCDFCATGKLKRVRNLNADEIYDQVVLINEQAKENYGLPLSNIVYMGMGEPLLNYKNVLQSIHHITSEDGLAMSPRRITVSTAGIAKLIKQLGDDEVRFNLALSLHAANDEKRSKIMPINDSNTLEALADALKYFYEKTGTRVTYEYIIFKDFNDELEDARELFEFCQHVPCKVNIIEYNTIDGGVYFQADPKKVDAFANYLESKNVIVNIRRSRGKDIDAACGQLANKNEVSSTTSS